MYKLVLLLVLAAGISAFATPVAYNVHYYDVIVAHEITWDNARAAALGDNYLGLEGHLVTITSAGENAAVHDMIVNNGGGEMWAGAYQNPTTETNPTAGWTWVNGEGSFPGVNGSPTIYTNWNGGEPNDAYGSASEQYMGLNWGAGGWNDEGYLPYITGYVIEYDPTTINDVSVPEPEILMSLGLSLLGLAGIARKKRS